MIWPTPRATTRSAIKVFSVSPERWETMTPQPSDCESWALYMEYKGEKMQRVHDIEHIRLDGLRNGTDLVDLSQNMSFRRKLEVT